MSIFLSLPAISLIAAIQKFDSSSLSCEQKMPELQRAFHQRPFKKLSPGEQEIAVILTPYLEPPRESCQHIQGKKLIDLVYPPCQSKTDEVFFDSMVANMVRQKKLQEKTHNSILHRFLRGIKGLSQGLVRHLPLEGVNHARMDRRYQNDQNPSEYITRSSNLNSKRLRAYNKALEKQGSVPAIPTSCLDAIQQSPACQQVTCGGEEIRVKKCQETLNEECPFYSENGPRPLFMYLHIYGHSSSTGAKSHSSNDLFLTRGNYAIEMAHLSRILGFRFVTPFDAKQSTLIDGENLFTSKTKKANSPTTTLLRMYNYHEKEGLDCALMSYRKDHPLASQKELTKIAIKSLLEREKENPGKALGNWENVLSNLQMIIEQKGASSAFFCHGGKHKTGIMDMMLLALMEDARKDRSYSSKQQMTFGRYKDNGRLHLADHRNGLQGEYYRFNPEEARESNLQSVQDFLTLVREPWNKIHEQKMLQQYDGFVTEQDINTMRKKWGDLTTYFAANK